MSLRTGNIQRRCLLCRGVFYTPLWRVEQGKGKFCSRNCARESQVTTGISFFSKVNKLGPVHPLLGTRCWLWEGYIHESGYGVIVVKKKGVVAHRMSWELLVGPIPDDRMLCHHCDNKWCVNPVHLFVGSNLDNIADRDRKGRQARGETCALSKLSEQQVIKIRSKYVFGAKPPHPGSVAQLSREFGISTSQVRFIVKRVCWKHI